MARRYSVIVQNRASHSARLMLFQSDPGSWSANAVALAWFSKFSNPSPTSQVRFSWTLDIGLAWAETGDLAPGATFLASELYDPTGGLNKITLDYNQAYFFTDPQRGEDAGRIYLEQSANIPVGSQAAVGVTMSGKTVYATQARPNENHTFSPKPTYYLAYGDYVEGEVIDISSINDALALVYPPGVYALETTLNADNTWTPPKTIPEANRARVQYARAHGPAREPARALS